MRKTTLLALVGALALGAGASAQQAALQTAATALGIAKIKTLQFTGSGRNFSVGQNYTSTEPWPAVPVKSYTAVINFETGAMRVDMTREMGPVMPRGGTEVSFVVGGKYKMTGTINAQGQVEKVQTWIDHPIVGDMLVETTYSGYKDFGGVMFPRAFSRRRTATRHWI